MMGQQQPFVLTQLLLEGLITGLTRSILDRCACAEITLHFEHSQRNSQRLADTAAVLGPLGCRSLQAMIHMHCSKRHSQALPPAGHQMQQNVRITAAAVSDTITRTRRLPLESLPDLARIQLSFMLLQICLIISNLS